MAWFFKVWLGANETTPKKTDAMKQFTQKHAHSIAHTLSGFDRIRFGGSISLLTKGAGLRTFFEDDPCLYYRPREFFEKITKDIVASGNRMAKTTGRPLKYLNSSSLSKQRVALAIAAEDGITEGLICILTCVEPCYTFAFQRQSKDSIEWKPRERKCLHQYFYFQDPEFGLINFRLQTWCPFRVTVNINGREWLARQMDRCGIQYRKADNCFLSISDPAAAQQLALQQTRRNFNSFLDRLCRQCHPVWHSGLRFRGEPLDYYWTMKETEWATDVVFHSQDALDAIYGDLLRFALLRFDSTHVMRFLGRTAPLPLNSDMEVHSNCRRRPEGARVRHYCGANSVKAYNKQHRVLRVETTINNPKAFTTVRPRLDDPDSPKKKRPVPKGVAGARDRARVSQQVNNRYLDALAGADVPGETVGDLLLPLSQRITWDGRPIRGLRFFDNTDSQLLAAIARGEFAIHGFRNRDIRELLAGRDLTPGDLKKLTSRITRLLRMLRAHRVIARIKGTHRYQLTDTGNRLVSALAVTQKASLTQLLAVAA